MLWEFSHLFKSSKKRRVLTCETMTLSIHFLSSSCSCDKLLHRQTDRNRNRNRSRFHIIDLGHLSLSLISSLSSIMCNVRQQCASAACPLDHLTVEKRKKVSDIMFMFSSILVCSTSSTVVSQLARLQWPHLSSAVVCCFSLSASEQWQSPIN